MGTSLHCFAERRTGNIFPINRWEPVKDLELFKERSWPVFALFAGLCNRYGIKPIAKPRGLPWDVSKDIKYLHDHWSRDGHTASWLSIDELKAVDYDQLIDPELEMAYHHPTGTTVRQLLTQEYFDQLELLSAMGAARIVFWFDN